MIETTTGVLFLISSIYGAGTVNGEVNHTIIPKVGDSTVEKTENSTFTASNVIDVEKYVRSEFAGTPILVDIARCESRFHQFDSQGNLIRGIVNNADVGVMQINEKYHGDTAKKLGLDLYTAEGNVAYAKYLYKKYGSEPWKSSSKCWNSSSSQVAVK